MMINIRARRAAGRGQQRTVDPEIARAEPAFVPLHGLDYETPNATGATVASVRFAYDYTDDELYTLSGGIRDVARLPAYHHVILNKYSDQGQHRARTQTGFDGNPTATKT